MPGSLTVGPGGQIQGSILVNRTSDQGTLSKGQETLRSLAAGDSLNGKVISVYASGDGTRTAQIDLGNNTIVDAKLQNGMQLSNGQTISFSVKSSASGTLTLTPLYQNTAALDATASKALLAAGLPLSDENGQMVLSMMKEGMSIDKQSLLNMSRIITDYSSSDIGSLVQMKNLNIPISEENITQFQNYQNYQHQLLDGAHAIMDELPKAFNQMVTSGDRSGALDLYGDLMKLFTTPSQIGDISQNPSDSKFAIGDPNTALRTDQENVTNSQDGLSDLPKTLDEKTIGIQKDSNSNPEIEILNGDRTLLNSDIGKEQSKAFIISDVDKEVVDNKNLQNSLVAGSNSVSARSAGNALYLSSRLDLIQFASALKDSGVPASVLNDLIKSGSQDQTSFLRQLSDLYDKTIHSSSNVDKAWGKFFSTDTFTDVLKNNISAQWTIKPGDVSDKDNVKNFYDRLNSQAKQLTQLLQGNVGENSSAFQSSQNLSSNIDFMNQLNQMYAYVQLPLKMSGNDTHSDLYVYSNKKHLASDDGSVSALLHLDMNNLGPLDVFVKMTDRKVSTNFYMADESCIDLIMEHIDELTARLNKRGYQMNYQVLSSDDKESSNQAIDKLLQRDDKMTILSMTSFDARA